MLTTLARPLLTPPPPAAGERLDRKAAILLAAERLFAQRGYHGVSLRQIAAEAGVPLALVGYYYGAKHELFHAIFAHWQPTIDQRLALLHQALASMAVQVLSAAALSAGAWALGVQAAWPAWAFAMTPIFLLAALPVSVGGWGTREAAAVLALAPFGVDAAGAVGAALVYGLYGLAQGGAGALAFGLGAARNKNA